MGDYSTLTEERVKSVGQREHHASLKPFYLFTLLFFHLWICGCLSKYPCYLWVNITLLR